ncbi:MAG: PDZ domain-containing protein [Acidimicrobiia bacterium]|nr:PDZ domain-containing protein [Acidimicrobiia bacterium]MYB73473.1 PDZ domain-containing protein [Acidimicrobiia bacterium]MYH99742.1 PDZ domain-containing protein [Acidimicrobiia bacterium]
MTFHQVGSSGSGQPPATPLGNLRASREGWGGLMLVVGLLALVQVFWGLPMLIVVLAVIGMIFLHEMGHFVAARAAGMSVTEFFLGFGPRLWSVRRGETVYGIKAIPAGAYVRIIGMNNLEEVPPADEHRTYRSKPYWRRMSVAVAGSTVHFLLALVLIFSFLVIGGKHEDVPSPDWTVNFVAPGSPAEGAGLLPGDRIVSVDDSPVATMSEMVAVLPEPGTPVSLGVDRGGEELVRTLTLSTHPDDSNKGFIGISSASAWSRHQVEVGYFEAVPETLDEFGFLVKESVFGIGRFFSPSGLSEFFRDVADEPAQQGTAPAGGGFTTAVPADDGDRVVSIFGALKIGADLTENGYGNLLLFLALLNVFIGVFNMIPLLPFDGGHVVIATYERLRSWRGRRYSADVSKMVPVAYAVILILAFVFIGSVYLDFTDPVEIPS